MPDYRVQTDVYNGPMDLLLFLIKRHEVDLYDIPVSEVTEQYCQYVETIRVIDPNIAGEFLVMAAMLMEIKSRMLLPRPVADSEDPEDLADPRLELVRQLLEYKKFKDASIELHQAADNQAQRWPRMPASISQQNEGEDSRKARVVELDDVQIWDLVATFNKIMSAIGAGQASHDVIFDDTPISLHAADILDRLQCEGGEMAFEALFIGRNKVEMIGLFLALLELMRQVRVRVIQKTLFAPIFITLLSADPIEVGEEWVPAFRDAVLGSEDSSPAEATVQTESHPQPAGPSEQPHSAAVEMEDRESLTDTAEALGDELDDDESAGFEELDRIKVDVDIDAILKHAPPTSTDGDPNHDPQEPISS